jgi:hypothetical protein
MFAIYLVATFRLVFSRGQKNVSYAPMPVQRFNVDSQNADSQNVDKITENVQLIWPFLTSPQWMSTPHHNISYVRLDQVNLG